MKNEPALVVFVDVDDTLIRTLGSKRIPIPGSIAHIRKLKAEGATLYCWSSGGAKYAKGTAEELRIADCFTGFIPKPQIIIDDQNIHEWKYFRHYLPGVCERNGMESYLRDLDEA